MSFTNEELIYLRTLAPGLSDNVLTRRHPQTGAGFVPDDKSFYDTLEVVSKALGVQPADILVVLASESNLSTGTMQNPIIATPGIIAANGFDPGLLGKDIAPRGLPGFTASMVPTVLSPAEWDALPHMNAAQQLAIVGRMYALASKRIGGRHFQSAFELYLANANPGSLVASGNYNENTPMYKGAAWETNLVLDHGPSGLNAIGYVLKNGETSAYYANPIAYAHKLAAAGIIKGYVTLGDLREHASRMTKVPGDPGYEKGWDLAWKLGTDRHGKSQDKAQPLASTGTLVSSWAKGQRHAGYIPDLNVPSMFRSAFRVSGSVTSPAVEAAKAASGAELAGSR